MRAAVVLLLALVLAAPAAALTSRQVFGIGNVQDPAAFAHPDLQALEPGATRAVADWDVARRAGQERERIDAWYAHATAAGLEPLLAFQGFNRPRAPSVRAYARAVRAALARWPRIREWQAFNEANHRTQPATYRHPRRAAAYARALQRACPGCTVLPVTLVLSDSERTRSWLRRFLRAYGRTPRVWALHTYGDANRFTNRRLRGFLARHPRGRVWITETGAFAKFADSWPYDLRRQRRATPYVFRAALRFRRRVDRLYWWQWRGDPRPRRIRWDSGLVDAWGRPRPAYFAALEARFSLP